ncbi:hypothetical protein ACJMK2_026547 [Sinanodonta woodiana]|uniref:Uncharacterized protein n=1 Tax=Sinanodonta woodiana TaxID=1069815 RepID=A0ABD3XK45_SINWO
MDVTTRISLVLIWCGNVYSRVWNSTILAQGYNGTINIDMPKSDLETLLEINFYGYSSKQHFSNIFLYINGQNGSISINSNYTGRIERVENNSGQLSFLLLNVMFNDSGNYTIKKKFNVKETTCVLVSSRIEEAKRLEPFIFSFMVYETNTSFIRVENPISKLSQPVVIYNTTNNICTEIDIVSLEKKTIENCVLGNGIFSFTIPDIGWLHKGSYFAWDDKDRLLDSIFLDIKAKVTWLIISALGITILSTSLVVVVVWKLRVRRARKSTMDNSPSSRGILPMDQRSNNAFIPEETRRDLTTQNLNDLTELTTNHLQPRLKLNDQNMCVRRLICSKSSVNTKCNFQIDSRLSLAATIQSDSTHSTHRYDYVHDIDELVSDCQSKQHYFCSKLLDTTSIGRKSQTSFENSYIVQRRFMSLRPPAPKPVLKKKQKQQTIVANSFYSHKHINKRSLPRYDPVILFARNKFQGTIKSHRTRSSNDLSLKCTNAVSSPSFIHSDKDLAKKDVDVRQKSRKVKCLESKVVALLPEPYQYRDSKPGSASQLSRTDYPNGDYDQAYAMEGRHRRSWSNDALYGDRIFSTKALRSRLFSDNSKPGNAPQCSRDDYYGDDYDQTYAMEKKHGRIWSNDALYGDRIFNTKDSRSRRFSDNSNPGSGSQFSRADYPVDDYDHAYAMERRHRRSWSSDALYGDRIFNIKASLSRRFSASKCMDEDDMDCFNKPGTIHIMNQYKWMNKVQE